MFENGGATPGHAPEHDKTADPLCKTSPRTWACGGTPREGASLLVAGPCGPDPDRARPRTGPGGLRRGIFRGLGLATHPRIKCRRFSSHGSSHPCACHLLRPPAGCLEGRGQGLATHRGITACRVPLAGTQVEPKFYFYSQPPKGVGSSVLISQLKV